MHLPDDFQFSQGVLQDFVDCKKRFQLRYIDKVAWPAVKTEPLIESEHYMWMGSRFHQMVQQHQLGIPEKNISDSIRDPDLLRWWNNYLNFINSSEGKDVLKGNSKIFPEVTLSAPLGQFRLMAKYDLVAVQEEKNGRVVIFDWKTSRRRYKSSWLVDRLQTRVYPYLIVKAGASLTTSDSIRPDCVEMVYWFAEFPDQPERIHYDFEKYTLDDGYLQDLVKQIKDSEDKEFPLTQDERRCRYCVYRSLCKRGVEAGTFKEDGAGLYLVNDNDVMEEVEIDIDLDQIAEIAF